MYDDDAITKKRGGVIERSLNIEYLISTVISLHYLKRTDIQFLLEVLYDDMCSFALKRNILLKIDPDFGDARLAKLHRLNRIRNYFAHCNLQIIEGIGGSFKIADKRIPKPGETKKSLDLSGMYDEFNDLADELEPYLAELIRRKGGQFCEEPRQNDG